MARKGGRRVQKEPPVGVDRQWNEWLTTKAADTHRKNQDTRRKDRTQNNRSLICIRTTKKRQKNDKIIRSEDAEGKKSTDRERERKKKPDVFERIENAGRQFRKSKIIKIIVNVCVCVVYLARQFAEQTKENQMSYNFLLFCFLNVFFWWPIFHYMHTNNGIQSN